VRVEKRRGNDWRLMVLPEELRGRQLLKATCSMLSALRNPRAAVKVCCRRAYGFNAHSLRYAFITHLLSKGVSPSIIAKVTGHASLDYILRCTQVKTAEGVGTLSSSSGSKALEEHGLAPSLGFSQN
jgi:integrase